MTAMASVSPLLSVNKQKEAEKRQRSIFDLPSDFFDSCRLLPTPSSVSVVEPLQRLTLSTPGADDEDEPRSYEPHHEATKVNSLSKWSCNTCKSQFDSLEDQRFHFKSDIHRLNIKLSVAGKDTLTEEDFDKLCGDALRQDYEISSISGSEDEDDKDSSLHLSLHSGVLRNKIHVLLQTGERVSIWKCLLLDESDTILFGDGKNIAAGNGGQTSCLTEKEVIEKLKYLNHEPRDNSCLRVVLLSKGGHFAGCVFDGNSIMAHKTFHRYVVRAKAGKKQSSKDASGRAVHSAGASLRRYNELALKKDIQDLLTEWKLYFDASSCVLIYAPSTNRQLFFDGEKPYFSCHHHAIQKVPLTVRRPTFKETRRIYYILTQVSYEMDDKTSPTIEDDSEFSARISGDICAGSCEEIRMNKLVHEEATECCLGVKESDELSNSGESERDVTVGSTPLHEAAKSGYPQKVLELLEQGMDPCVRDKRGRTPYVLAAEKEVRNTFRRFMALNLDKWDWHAANVPSALTKELEESQAVKQAEKDAKRKARAKELKKLRKAREKKAQNTPATGSHGPALRTYHQIQDQRGTSVKMTKEEALKRARDEEREQRAAAAEKRMAAAGLKAQVSSSSTTTSCSSQPKNMVVADMTCSRCNASLAGKVPFHRYNFKYCSASCMHVHREILGDE